MSAASSSDFVDLSCPFCSERYGMPPSEAQPVCLSCGHSACRLCADAYLLTESPECPLCHEPIRESDIVVNSALLAILGSGTDAVQFHTDSSPSFSPSVSIAPTIPPSTQTIGDMLSEKRSVAGDLACSSAKTRCEKHSFAPLSFWCRVHNSRICPACALLDHAHCGVKICKWDPEVISGLAEIRNVRARLTDLLSPLGEAVASLTARRHALVTRCHSSCEDLAREIDALKAKLDAQRDVVLSLAKSTCSERVKVLDNQLDAMVVSYSQVNAALHACDAVLNQTSPSVPPQLLTSLQRASSLSAAGNCNTEVSPMVEIMSSLASLHDQVGRLVQLRTQLAPADCVVTGPGITSFVCGDDASTNRVIIKYMDAPGEPLPSLHHTDFVVTATTACGRKLGLTCVPTETCGEVHYAYTVPVDVEDDVTVRAWVAGGVELDCSPWRAWKHRKFPLCTFQRSIRVMSGLRYGLAVNRTETLMAVTCFDHHFVALYELPSGAYLRSFGRQGSAPSEFNRPYRCSFVPSNGHLMVVDGLNHRIQEFTETGIIVRCIPVEWPTDVRTNGAIMVVGVDCEGKCGVTVMDYRSGKKIRDIAPYGPGPGCVKSCYGVRLFADGNHVLVSEAHTPRLSMFTLTGTFVRHFCENRIGKGEKDVEIGPSGEIVVADRKNKRVVVFNDKDETTDCIGTGIKDAETVTEPCALASVNGRLYVLDPDTARVQVYL